MSKAKDLQPGRPCLNSRIVGPAGTVWGSDFEAGDDEIEISRRWGRDELGDGLVASIAAVLLCGLGGGDEDEGGRGGDCFLFLIAVFLFEGVLLAVVFCFASRIFFRFPVTAEILLLSIW